MWCSAPRGRIGGNFDSLSEDYGTAIETNHSVHLWTRFASVDERMDWMTTFIYCWTRNSRVGNRIGLSFRTIISNFMSGRKRNEMGYRKTWIILRRKPVIRTSKVQKTQHSRKEPFTNAWNMPKQPCGGTRSSCVGLNNVDLRWIHCLRQPSRKAAVIRTPHSIVSGAQSDGTLWLSSGRSGCQSPRQRVKTYGLRRPRLQYPSLSP